MISFSIFLIKNIISLSWCADLCWYSSYILPCPGLPFLIFKHEMSSWYLIKRFFKHRFFTILHTKLISFVMHLWQIFHPPSFHPPNPPASSSSSSRCLRLCRGRRSLRSRSRSRASDDAFVEPFFGRSRDRERDICKQLGCTLKIGKNNLR